MSELFNEYGFLPRGPQPYTIESLRQDFILHFRHPQRRMALFQGLVALRDSALDLGLCGFQYVNGSFTINKEEPDDIDVVTFIDADLVNCSCIEAQRFIREVLDCRSLSKERYLIDSHFVPVYRMDHKDYDLFKSLRQYWVTVFEEPREMPYGEKKPRYLKKGFIVLPLGDYDIERGLYVKTSS
ncbi:MAG: DUF6932 family protein [Armatimonadota bacterium]